MKFFLLLSTLIIFCFCTKAQTSIDSLSVNPNPFINRTVLNYSFTNNDTVSITVMNLVGQNVLTLFTNSVMPSGTYQDSLIMDSYPAGVYFVQLKLGSRKSKVVKAIKQNPTQINEWSNDNQVTIYPNPFNTELNIEFNSSQKISKINVYNSLGQIVCSFDEIKQWERTNLEHLERGIYLLKIENLLGRQMIKIIKD